MTRGSFAIDPPWRASCKRRKKWPGNTCYMLHASCFTLIRALAISRPWFLRRKLSKNRHRWPRNLLGNATTQTSGRSRQARADSELVPKRSKSIAPRRDGEHHHRRRPRSRPVAKRDAERIAKLRADRTGRNGMSELCSGRIYAAEQSTKPQEVTWNRESHELRAKLAERGERLELADIVEERPSISKNRCGQWRPRISDRRIPLHGLITMETAELSVPASIFTTQEQRVSDLYRH